MSFYSRRNFLSFLSLPVLGACGFTPVLAPGGSAAGMRGSFLIGAPGDRFEYVLVGRLLERLGQPNGPRYGLTLALQTDRQGLAIDEANNITRYNLTGRLGYTVTLLGSEETAATGEVTNFTSYSTTGSPVSTRTAERDAYDRLMVSLADLLVSRLLVTAPDWKT